MSMTRSTAWAADLQTKAAALDGEERGRAPALRSAATGHAASVTGAHDESAFEHGGNDRHAFGRSQHFFGDALVGSGFDLFQHGAGSFHAVFGFVLVFIGVFVCIISQRGNGETATTHRIRSFFIFLTFGS